MRQTFTGLLLAICTLGIFYSFSTKSINNMEDQVKEQVHLFAKAIAKQNVEQLDKLLHEKFRVVANQYPKPEATSILDKSLYLSMIGSKKIGGHAYEVSFQEVHVQDHTATVIATFGGAQSNMYLTLLMVQSAAGDWQIVSDLPVIK